MKFFGEPATFRAGSDSNPRVAEVTMVVITSIFVAEIKGRLRSESAEPLEWDLSVPERRNALDKAPRELISLFEGKNRVEPIE